jgi:hypothetical protein
MQDPNFLEYPQLIESHEVEETQPAPLDDFESTRPTPLFELPKQTQIDHEMAIIRAHHARIANAIDVFWGHPDCDEYLQQLIISGGDGFGNARIGFKHEIVAALINLSTLHEAKPR